METEFWMSKLSDINLEKPLNQLAIPGSHDSFTCQITSSSEIGPDIRPGAQKLINYSGAYGKQFLMKWIITQNLNANDQLLKGVRYFDIRIGKNNEDFFITHQLLSDKMDSYLRQINTFLNLHGHEVVILDFNHVYLDRSDYERLISLVDKIFGDKIAPYRTYCAIPSLNALWKHQHQVLLFYHHNASDPSDSWLSELVPEIWPEELIPSFWPNTTDPGIMTTYLSEALRKKDSDKFHISQGILTPTAWTLFCHPFYTLKYFLADRATPATVRWFSSGLSSSNRDKINIVIVDFVEEHNFIDSLLKLNVIAN